jgi:hypothetical protein
VSGISILDSNVKIGGRKGYFTIKKNENDVPMASKPTDGKGSNSAIALDKKGDTFNRASGELSSGVGVSIAGDKSVDSLSICFPGL